MNKSDEIRLTQWIDGELTDDDVRDLLQQDPSLMDLRSDSRLHGQSLRQAFPQAEIPYGDFFNNQIRQRAEVGTGAGIDSRLSRSADSFVSMLMGILTTPRWVAGLAMGAAVMLMFLLLAASSNFRNYSEVVHTYTPQAGLVAKTDYNENAGVTVITIDGMADVPTTAQISGYFPASSERDALLASTTLYSAEHKPILVVSTNGNGLPQFHEFGR